MTEKVTPEEMELSSVLEEEETENNTKESVGPDGKELKKCVQPGKQLSPAIRGAIKEWWFNRAPYADIHDVIASAGYYIPKAQLTVWADKQWPEALPVPEVFDPAFLALSPERQAVQLLWAKAVLAIQSITPCRAYAIKNIVDMSTAIARISATQQTLDKIDQDKRKEGGDIQRILDAAKEQIMAEARRILDHRPDLLQPLEQICSVIEEATENTRLLQ